MEKFLFLALALLLPTQSFALPLTTDQKFVLNNVVGGGALPLVSLGDAIDSSKALVKVVYDTQVNSNGSSTVLNGAHSMGVYLPANAVIMRAWYHILTKLDTTAAGSTGQQAQLAFRCETPGNIKTAGAMNALAANVITAGVPDNTIANWKQITNRCQVVADVTKDNFSTGTLALFLEYYVSH